MHPEVLCILMQFKNNVFCNIKDSSPQPAKVFYDFSWCFPKIYFWLLKSQGLTTFL